MTTGPAALLRRAAYLLQYRAAQADKPGTRWMVDQDDEGALVLASYWPEDTEPGQPHSTSTVASYAYPDHPDLYTHAQAIGAASHSSALDPATAVALAAWLQAAADFADQAEALGGLDRAAPLLAPAIAFAETYLRLGQSL
ncbi:hypothetical protein [Streptomyces sp. TLI_171]|uniref:hypothetical protein n=1 Tax=Streptomyces sp. TLI_171 TaxID=1938859 RepID=UPI000E76E83A|nr:hypothetical protein [Streptomyces sp. TLI_171]